MPRLRPHLGEPEVRPIGVTPERTWPRRAMLYSRMPKQVSAASGTVTNITTASTATSSINVRATRPATSDQAIGGR